VVGVIVDYLFSFIDSLNDSLQAVNSTIGEIQQVRKRDAYLRGFSRNVGIRVENSSHDFW